MTQDERAMSRQVFLSALAGAAAGGKDPKAAVAYADAVLTQFADKYGVMPPHPLDARDTSPPPPYRFNAWWENSTP